MDEILGPIIFALFFSLVLLGSEPFLFIALSCATGDPVAALYYVGVLCGVYSVICSFHLLVWLLFLAILLVVTR